MGTRDHNIYRGFFSHYLFCDAYLSLYGGRRNDSSETWESFWNDRNFAVVVAPHHAAATKEAEGRGSEGSQRSWFELTCFFLPKELREAVRGDIGELRLQMRTRGYGRGWIEVVTAWELIRSFHGSLGRVLNVVEWLRRVFFG